MRSFIFLLITLISSNVYAVASSNYDEIHKECLRNDLQEHQIELCEKITLIEETRKDCMDSEEKCDEMEIAYLQILYLVMKMKGY